MHHRTTKPTPIMRTPFFLKSICLSLFSSNIQTMIVKSPQEKIFANRLIQNQKNRIDQYHIKLKEIFSKSCNLTLPKYVENILFKTKYKLPFIINKKEDKEKLSIITLKFKANSIIELPEYKLIDCNQLNDNTKMFLYLSTNKINDLSNQQPIKLYVYKNKILCIDISNFKNHQKIIQEIAQSPLMSLDFFSHNYYLINTQKLQQNNAQKLYKFCISNLFDNQQIDGHLSRKIWHAIMSFFMAENTKHFLSLSEENYTYIDVYKVKTLLNFQKMINFSL